ncbi:MAG TPA: hypothetical protein VFA33_01860 [Bryobacteraceae bacterium]|nr:hypothetical protein [Bryobacteraceae bacterium]
MITFTLVAILGVLLVIVLRELFKKQASEPPRALPKEDLANLRVTDARVGDTLSVTGAGDEFSDLDFTVDRRDRWQAGERQWVELSGTYKERRVWLRVRQDDELEVSAVVQPKKLTLGDLGLTEEDLAEIDDRQNTEDSFEYDGKVWYYRLSRESTLYRDGHAPPQGSYYWEFQEEGGGRLLFIRKAEGEPFTATVAVRLNPADVTVYRAG